MPDEETLISSSSSSSNEELLVEAHHIDLEESDCKEEDTYSEVRGAYNLNVY